MENLIIDNLILAVLIPFWIFLIIMGGRFFSVYVNKIIIYTLTLLGSLYGTAVSLAGLKYMKSACEYSIPFIKIHDFGISAGIHVDKLSLIFALVLFSISFCIQLYSISFMKEEKKNYKFFAFLNLFNFGMSALILSPNLYQMYVFWELVGIVSYLLIGFDYTQISKSIASKKVFLVNRIGDTALIAAIIITTSIIYNYSGNLSYIALEIPDLNTISTILMGYTSTPVFLGICCLFILAAIVKSAQYPFHIWLQDAMEAKTPVSALLHSATMVAAGIYLIIRILPFLTLNKLLLYIVFGVGIITAIICPILASIETNPKKILAYSTSANLGLIFAAIGLGNIKAALLLMVAHAVIKSSLFLTLPKNEKIFNITFGILILASLSLAGIIFAGIPAKEYFYCAISNKIIKYVFIFTSFMTAFYITRLVFIIFKNTERQRSFDFLEVFAAILLLGMNIAFCIYFRNIEYKLCYPFIASVAAVPAVFILHKFNLLTRISTTPKLSESILYNLIPKIYNFFADLLNKIEKNIFCNYKIITGISGFLVKLSGIIEFGLMQKSVTNFGKMFKTISVNDSVMQKKNVQVYNAYALILVTITLILIAVAYKLISAKFTGGN